MRADLNVYLYTTLPNIKKITNEDDDSTRDEVELDANNQPVVN
jgi:hypothetical protein